MRLIVSNEKKPCGLREAAMEAKAGGGQEVFEDVGADDGVDGGGFRREVVDVADDVVDAERFRLCTSSSGFDGSLRHVDADQLVGDPSTTSASCVCLIDDRSDACWVRAEWIASIAIPAPQPRSTIVML